MEQVYRRQLLALGRLEGDAVDAQRNAFVAKVLADKLASRPDTQGVQDVLSSSGAAPAVVARFVDAFNAAVWGSPTT